MSDTEKTDNEFDETSYKIDANINEKEINKQVNEMMKQINQQRNLGKLQLTIKSVENNIAPYYSFIKYNLDLLGIKHSRVNLPKKTKRICLLKSPHVNKKALEHFEMTRYKMLIDVKLTNNNNASLSAIKFLIMNKPQFMKVCLKKIA